jgi:hypothetical protein
MENFQKETKPTRTGSSRAVETPVVLVVHKSLAETVFDLQEKVKILERTGETKKKQKPFQFPFKWKRKFSQAKSKQNTEKILVLFLNKKNEIEPPKFMPIYEGNMVIWRNKPYEFDPRAVLTLRGIKGAPRVYFIKEIDRRPVRNEFGKIVYTNATVSNMNLDEIRARGDSTESDEFLIKAALRAQVAQQQKKKVSWIVIGVIIVIIGVAAYFLLKGGGTAVH